MMRMISLVQLEMTGEIVVRPKEPWILFSGYYGMSEATVETWQNLWFHTGDRGRMDEEGYFYFVDRKKDVIRRKRREHFFI